ncbi:MAG: aconitate hydratase AcnA, partial [Rhodospirillales bacterium]
PPGTGICHQVNIEYLAQTVWSSDADGETLAYPDTLVGTDSHTTMVNSLAVLGWGVGGIEAEACMLGQPISMMIPEVVGFKFTGELKEGATATDLVLTVVQMLREKGVVGKFVEYFGDGLEHLTLPDRATIANMAPEYGATCGFFPIDRETLRYLSFTGRDEARLALVEAYAKEQGLWHDRDTPDPVFTDTLELDLATVEPAIAGPKRPQDKILLSKAAEIFGNDLPKIAEGVSAPRSAEVAGTDYELKDGAVVIAAITSCTNTSNPTVLIGAGLLAKNAIEKSLAVKPWVKTSLAPGSQVVAEYLKASGLQAYLDRLGYNIAGFGCTTCIGNSGPLAEPIAAAIEEGDLVAAAVLSGNRNFEGRIHPLCRANYLASPMLVVAYALAGSMTVDLYNDPLGTDADGKPVFMKDIWPSNKEIRDVIETVITPEMFRSRYADVFAGNETWRTMSVPEGDIYEWQPGSTYIRRPTFFDASGTSAGAGAGEAAQESHAGTLEDIHGARPLLILGDSITTDHISPAGSIKEDSPAGEYLTDHQVRPKEFNSYGLRRGNHEVMVRGTFANIRIRNEMVPDIEGGFTKHWPDGEVLPIFAAAMKYQNEGVPLIVIGGKEYGTGSSRDWAAKGSRLLGVRAVIVESFERIHRSNLIGMGVIPLQFKDGVNRKTLKLDGTERFDITGIGGGIEPGMDVACRIARADGSTEDITLLCRIDTQDEAEYFKAGGILQYVLSNLKAA